MQIILKRYELIEGNFKTIGFSLNNSVIAHVDYEVIEDNSIILNYIFVKEEFRGKGFGKQLISILKNRYSSISGYVLGEAEGFYKHLGFTISKTQVNRQLTWKQKQTKLEDFNEFKPIVKAYVSFLSKYKRFCNRLAKKESKGLVQTVLSPISEDKVNGGLIE